MDAELIEKVARAIYGANSEFQPGWDFTHPRYKDRARAQARAALSATPQAATPQADRRAIKLLVAAGFVTEEKANEALNIAHGFQPGPLAATPQAEPDTESADFKEGFAVGRAEAQSLAASIKHPACGQCGATCAKDAEAKCRPSGDSCPGVEWPLADLWALQQPATPQAAQVPEAYTTGHCDQHRKPGGCTLHNLQCGYPGCDRRPLAAAQAQGVGRG